MSSVPEDMLIVGRIGKPHGVRGDVYVDLITDRIERLAPGSRLMTTRGELIVESSRSSGRRWVVHFAGYDDRATAGRLTLLDLSAAPLDDPEAIWIHELIGAEVVDVEGHRRGRCVAVIDNPAADLLELDSGALVPMTFVVSIDDGVITVDTPEGLFELSE